MGTESRLGAKLHTSPFFAFFAFAIKSPTRRPLLLCLCFAFLSFPAFAQDAPAPDTDWDDSAWEDSDVFYAGEITVTGTRTEKRLADSPVATEIITAEEIENSSANTLGDVLEDYGVMASTSPMGDAIQLQGMGESRVLFLVDGRRLPGRVRGNINGSTLPLGNVERIEIVRGPQSSLYGSDGIGGVVNIITKKPGDSFSLTAGVANSFTLAYDDTASPYKPGPLDNVDPVRDQQLSATVGVPVGPARNSLSVQAGRSGFYFDERSRTSILPRTLRGQAALDTALSPTELSELRLGGSVMILRSDQQTTPSENVSRSDYLRAEGFVNYELFPRPDLSLVFRLFDNYYRRDRSAYTVADDWANTGETEDENLVSLEAAGVYAGLSNWVLSAGLEGSFNSMAKFNLTEPVGAMDREAVYVQAERFRQGAYSVLAGFRLERNSRFGFAYAPKLSAMWHIPKPGGGESGFRLLGSAGVGYRAPNFNDLYLEKDDPPHPLVRGNPDLRPEYAVSGSAGLEYARQRGYATANGYYTEMFDEIAFINTGLMERGMIVYDTGNISRSFRAGADTEGKVSFLSWGFASAGYSYLYAFNRSEGRQLHAQPSHTVKFRLGLDTGKPGAAGDGAAQRSWGLHAWVGGRFFSALYPDDPASDPRLVLDAYAALFLGRHFKVHLSADNLTGTVDVFLGPAVPQTLSLGLAYTY
jgi:outer membrane receptor for ferrienterochelin and colicins